MATIFRTRKGALVGPVKEAKYWAVFVVEKIEPPVQATLEQSRDEIEQLLSSTRRQRGARRLREEVQGQDSAPGYRVPRCNNGPKKAGAGV